MNQELMDKAWFLACEELSVEDADTLTPSEFQSLNDLQTKVFLALGGDLDRYYEEAA